ncbi:MAG: rRNA pseudouridine synthase [Waddliaceae bacterium]|mgnify:FL=1|jgi:23S rRNA pseudouridine2605 synthase|nr:rRNA pseudouridine synthase [Waddliaceae bacterium]
MTTKKQRLSKVLAAAGIASRRGSEKIIFEGKVSVNGVKTLVPQTMVDSDIDKIRVGGKLLNAAEEKKIFILNKPLGYLCSSRRVREDHRLVIDLFRSTGLRLFTVGRLDRDTGGLLFVTNDGAFANDIIHPNSAIEKEYFATVDRAISKDDIAMIMRGVHLDGIFVKPLEVTKINKNTISVIVSEGKKHEVRILVKNAGFKIKSLTRIRIGGLSLPKNLAPGDWRELTKYNKNAIFNK